LEVQFGEGGSDSKLFVHDLFAAYCKYSIANNVKVELLSSSNGHIVAKFIGKKAGQLFKNESGKHCVQRVPPTESKGRVHTSIISVAVLPFDDGFKQLDKSEIQCSSSIKTQGGHGKGGQHQNKRSCAVRMVHKATKLSVFINGRSQLDNKKEALRILSAKVNAFYKEANDKKNRKEIKKQLGGGGRSDKIRTYNFVNSRVVDHRLGLKTRRIKDIMKGKFELLFQQ